MSTTALRGHAIATYKQTDIVRLRLILWINVFIWIKFHALLLRFFQAVQDGLLFLSSLIKAMSSANLEVGVLPPWTEIPREAFLLARAARQPTADGCTQSIPQTDTGS